MSGLSSTKHRVCWASAALVVVALGCGGSTDTPSGAGASGGSGGSGASGGTDGTGGSGGSGGSTTGGTGGSGASGGSGGVPDAGEVICGGMVCPSPMLGGISACCTTPQNTCGVSFSVGGQPGTCYEPPTFDAGPRIEAGTGVPDPNCASLTITGFTLAGCCMPDNVCGFLSQFAGCVSIDALRMINLPGLPDGGPMSCVYPPPGP